MKNKTINELTSLENPRLTDTLPIWDGTEGKTKKVSLAKIPANVITPVDSLPESPNILDRVYRYNNKYYVGNESAQTLTELASKADIPTVVDTIADGNMNPVTSNAVYDKLYGNVGAYYAASVNRPAGGWTIDSGTGHMKLSSADLTIANVPAGVYLAWIEASGDQNTTEGRHYCYNNNIAKSSFGYQETGWGGTIWSSCIYKHTGGNVVPSLATDFENFNPSSVRMVLQRLY